MVFLERAKNILPAPAITEIEVHAIIGLFADRTPWFPLHETAQEYMKKVLYDSSSDEPARPGVRVNVRFLDGETKHFFYLYDGAPEYALDKLREELSRGSVELFSEGKSYIVYKHGVASIEKEERSP